MAWQEGYIAVDWGTTNRRAWLIERGQCRGGFSDDMGVLAVADGGFPAAVEEIRGRLGDWPMLLGGMVGSDRGWREAPYLDCPAGAEQLAQGILWVDARTGIVPGLRQRGPDGPDVMRGEEIQLIGAVANGAAPPDGLVCHPGTHAKWAGMSAGRVEHFRTVMTGEAFALLREHSILAGDLAGEAAPDPGFDAGVKDALAGELPLAALFRIRARRLLGEGGGDGASRASGLLIGSEVAAMLARDSREPVTVLGRPDLCALYARALRLAGRASRVASGEEAFVSGISAVAALL